MYKAPISAYITNLGKYVEGELVGEWVDFPTTSDEMQEVLERIGIDKIRYEEIFITDYESAISGLTAHFGEYENLSELNYLAERIEDCDSDWLEAALELGECTGSVSEIINLIDNQDCFLVLYDISNDYDLGYYYIHETWGDTELSKKMGELANYIDYESYGKDVCLSEGGTYTDNGCYICLLETPTKYFESLDDIPDEYRICA